MLHLIPDKQINKQIHKLLVQVIPSALEEIKQGDFYTQAFSILTGAFFKILIFRLYLAEMPDSVDVKSGLLLLSHFSRVQLHATP